MMKNEACQTRGNLLLSSRSASCVRSAMDGLLNLPTNRAAGCRSKLPSIDCIATSPSYIKAANSTRRHCVRRCLCGLSPARTAVRFVRCAVSAVVATTIRTNGALLLFRFGASSVFFVYRMRRVDCRTCGVKIEQVPWAAGKHRLTEAYCWFLARWAKRLSWKETAEAFGTSWDTVYRSVRYAVLWGLVARRIKGFGTVEAIGVDEIQWQKGHRYLTLVYQIDGHCRRLLWVGRDRTEKALHGFFDLHGPAHYANLEVGLQRHVEGLPESASRARRRRGAYS